MHFDIHDYLGAYWRTSMEQGMTNWNNSAAPVSFYISESSTNAVITRYALYGLNTLALGTFVANSGASGSLSGFYITLCPENISNHAGGLRDINNVIASVMAHELGHAVGLRDGGQGDRHPTILGGSSNASLMNSGRNRNTIVGPTAFDIESTRLIYDY